MATDLFDAYRSGTARAFFAGHYTDAADRRRAVQRALRPLAPVVADAVTAQNAGLTPSAARDAHVAALRRGAAAVVTGQQMGLFLGPLYTLYKAASAVRVARALAEESGQPVVPVFWLQTEDHDLPEIAQCHVPRASGPMLTLQLPASPEERVSVAHRTLPAAVSECLDQLRAELGHFPHGAAHLACLSRHYRPGSTWAAAFAGVLGELFAPEGLVLLDPRDPTLAPAAAPVHQRALTDAADIAAALTARVEEITAAAFTAPVHVRAGAPLSFFHPAGHAGPRYRLVPAAGGYAEVHGSGVYTSEALLAALATEPRRFSTSVLLRPILQDTWLPTAAYVGGPAEVAYFAQLAPLYAAYGLAMPLVVPRAQVRVLEDKAARFLARWQLEPAAAEWPEAALLTALRAANHEPLDTAALAHALRAPFEAALADLQPRVAAAGPGLTTAIEKTRATVAAAIAKLASKYESACLHQDAALVDAVQRLKTWLFPHDTPQERVYGFPYFAARYGARPFIERVLAAIAPFDRQIVDMTCADPCAATAPHGEVGG